MQFDPVLIAALLVFGAFIVVDIYVTDVYQALGRRVLLRVSAGRFPPEVPSLLQRFVASVVGLALILAVLLLVFFIAKLVR